MSLYDEMKKDNPERFKVDVTANIDPCERCVVVDCKSEEHCGTCRIYLDKKKKNKKNKNIVSNPHNLNVIMV